MFISSSISSSLEFKSVNQTSVYEVYLGEISDNWVKRLLGTIVCKTLDFGSKLLLTIL